MRFPLITIFTFILALSFTENALAMTVNDEIYNDERDVHNEKTENFYDSLESKTTRNKIPQLIYNSLFTRTKSSVNRTTVDDALSFEPYLGRTIGEISIERSKVFNEQGSWAERSANKFHAVTHEGKIRKDLFFNTGDKIEPEQLVNNKQYLQSRSYLYDALIEVDSATMDSDTVNLTVKTRDSWSLGVDLEINPRGESGIEIYDANIFGTGNRLSLATYFDFKDMTYGGNYAKFNMVNMWGSFIDGEFVLGRSFDSSDIGFEIKKDFIQPSDYKFNVSLYDSKQPYKMLDQDSTISLKYNIFNAQLGKSFYLPGINSSFYMLGNVTIQDFKKRADVGEALNPAFHNTANYLLGLGLYREDFYSTNLVYGYGLKEYIARGYRAEIVGGYREGEFFSDMYMGLNFSIGGYSSLGHLMFSSGVGSYYEPKTNTWRQSLANVNIRYFSHLLKVSRYDIRQFVNISYTRGWNRLEGSDEYISFNRDDMRGLNEDYYGQNRFLANLETTVFTPFAPLGFRVALFAFADFGLLGDNVNMFKNDYYTTFGLGVRIKNERLIFSRIQLRLGFAISKKGWINSDLFRLSNNYELTKYRYIPNEMNALNYDL